MRSPRMRRDAAAAAACARMCPRAAHLQRRVHHMRAHARSVARDGSSQRPHLGACEPDRDAAVGRSRRTQLARTGEPARRVTQQWIPSSSAKPNWPGFTSPKSGSASPTTSIAIIARVAAGGKTSARDLDFRERGKLLDEMNRWSEAKRAHQRNEVERAGESASCVQDNDSATCVQTPGRADEPNLRSPRRAFRLKTLRTCGHTYVQRAI